MTISDRVFGRFRRKPKEPNGRLSNLAKHEARWGLFFLSPWIIGFLLFILLPTLATLFFSFTNFNILHLDEIRFIGIDNYTRMLTDPIVGQSLMRTFKFFIMAFPLAILIPILISALLNSENLFLRRFFSTMFYMPYMVPLVSAVLIWGGFLNPATGWMNKFLGFIGIAGPDWLQSTTWVYWALLIVGLWGSGNAIITTLAGMESVPRELFEAAKIEGAGPVSTFLNVTMPMISPIIFYNLTLASIGLFQYFLEPYVLFAQAGDPGGSTLFYPMYLFQNFFQFQEMAYGASLAWVLFLIILAFTAVWFGLRKYWVYEAERE
jgi:ABC-type sugar transport system permease subunit